MAACRRRFCHKALGLGQGLASSVPGAQYAGLPDPGAFVDRDARRSQRCQAALGSGRWPPKGVVTDVATGCAHRRHCRGTLGSGSGPCQLLAWGQNAGLLRLELAVRSSKHSTDTAFEPRVRPTALTAAPLCSRMGLVVSIWTQGFQVLPTVPGGARGRHGGAMAEWSCCVTGSGRASALTHNCHAVP